VSASADQTTTNKATISQDANCGNPTATTAGASSTPDGDRDRTDNIVNVELTTGS
jgi:hypothetical protein